MHLLEPHVLDVQHYRLVPVLLSLFLLSFNLGERKVVVEPSERSKPTALVLRGSILNYLLISLLELSEYLWGDSINLLAFFVLLFVRPYLFSKRGLAGVVWSHCLLLWRGLKLRRSLVLVRVVRHRL